MIQRVTGDGRLVPLGQRDRGPDPRQDRSTRANRGRRWMKLRAQILARDPVCKSCNRAASQQVDHIKPLAQGGDDSYANLQGLCIPCHQAKTASEAKPTERVERTSLGGTVVRHNPWEPR
jgi:5-methylcytosine-specific restriction enzyme A